MNRSEILAKLAAGEINVAEATTLLEGRGTSDSASDPDGGDSDPIRDQVDADAFTSNSQDDSDLSAKGTDRQTDGGASIYRGKSKRKLHIQVTDNDHSRVNVVLPVGLLRAGFWLGSKFSRRFPPDAWDSMLDALEDEDQWTLVQVEDGKDRVHIYVE
ncbi:MAG: hypothetical protein U0528_13685 [Anaerolineae bacterium]|nr:hypothetical protein [Anaerolineae bacterium]